MSTSLFNKFTSKCAPIIGVLAVSSFPQNAQPVSDSTNMVFQMLLLKQHTTFSVASIANGSLHEADSLTAQEIVSFFKENGMPVAVIADITNVERKSVYAWLNGGAVKHQNQARLEAVYHLLNADKQASFRDLYRLWNKQILSGITIGALLKEEDLNINSIKAALHQLWPLAKKQQQLAVKRIQNDDIKTNPFLRDTREVTTIL